MLRKNKRILKEQKEKEQMRSKVNEGQRRKRTEKRERE
jgi:hypothetical protein